MDIDSTYFFKKKNFLDKDICESITKKYFDTLEIFGDKISKNSRKGFKELRSAPIFKKEESSILSRLATLLDKDLLLAYSHVIFYEPGAVLPKHLDRPHSQYGININIWQTDDMDYPIYLTNPETKETTEIKQNIGDAFIYKACEVPHYRKELTTGNGIQFMVFGVEKGTDYEVFANDNMADNQEWQGLIGNKAVDDLIERQKII